MNSGKLEAKIASIEAQLKILKASKELKKAVPAKKGLRSLKGILKGKGKFDMKEIESTTIITRDVTIKQSGIINTLW